MKDDAVIVSQHARLREHGESHRMGEKDGDYKNSSSSVYRLIEGMEKG